MKLARRLGIALVALMLVLVVVSGALRVRHEATELYAIVGHDQEVLARALAPIVEADWATRGVGAAQQRVDIAEQAHPSVEMHWVHFETTELPPQAPLLDLRPHREALVDGQALHFQHIVGKERWLLTYLLVRGAHGEVSALEIAESLAPEERFLRHSILNTALTGLLLALLSALLVALIGVRMVGRPIGLLVAQARRIGEGDFSTRLALGTRDELDVLAKELNAMATRLEHARTRLEDETQARLRTLDQLRRADRLHTVGQLASGIAHELGTPLNVVSARALMIATGELEGTEAKESAQIVFEETERMTKIIGQLLDFARRRPVELTPQDVRLLATSVCNLLTPLAEKRGVTLLVEPGASAEAVVDFGLMQQVLTNLLVNAVHASHPGGRVHVRFRSDQRPALPADAAPDRPSDAPPEPAETPLFLCVEVEDHGDGIEESHLPHVFEPFFTTKDVGEGTGLGLSVSWGIVRDHKGFIDVESTVGRGSCFRVYLPRPVLALGAHSVENGVDEARQRSGAPA